MENIQNINETTRTQLFKTSVVVSKRIIKTLVIKYAIYANMFAEKNVSSFCICKSLSSSFAYAKAWVAFAYAKATQFFNKNICQLDVVLIRTVNILGPVVQN